MSLIRIDGVVQSFGPNTFQYNATLYSYIGIVEKSGRLVRVDNVLIPSRVVPLFDSGVAGAFHFDNKRGFCELYGIQTNAGHSAFESKVRLPVSFYLFVILGILCIPLVGIGFVWLAFALVQFLISKMRSRERRLAFYGNDPRVAATIRNQEAVTI